jgi:hypothetical protein
MSGIRASESNPGKWCLGNRELHQGDLVEVWFLGKWYTATVEFDPVFSEYRFRIYHNVVSCTEDIPARWSETN